MGADVASGVRRKKKYGKFRMGAGARRWCVACCAAAAAAPLRAALTRAARSNGCSLLTVKAAYHHMCRGATHATRRL